MRLRMLRLYAAAPVAVLVLLAAVGAQVATARAAQADSGSEESEFVAQINGLRARHGLPAYAVDPQLTRIARNWSSWMEGSYTLAHNPDLRAEANPWYRLGENVGVGFTVDSVERAFEQSPDHYPNLVDGGYVSVGVGVVDGGDGRIWVTEDFRQPPSSVAAATAVAPGVTRIVSRSYGYPAAPAAGAVVADAAAPPAMPPAAPDPVAFATWPAAPWQAARASAVAVAAPPSGPDPLISL